MALDFPVGTDFPANGNQIPDGHEHEGFYWDASTEVWKRLCERDKIGDCLDDGINETVCDKLEALHQDVIELEEEIEALAPSLERGSWNYTQPFQTRGYSLFDSGGNPTNRYTDATSIFISPTDADGTAHSFDNVVVGSYVEIFESGTEDFGLYQVTAVDDKTNLTPGYWVFDVDFIKSNSLLATANGLARFKFFELADAADPTSFVLKAGDTMTGNLAIDRSNGSDDVEANLSLVGNRPNSASVSASIKFENKQSSANGYLTYKSYGGSNWFTFTQDLDLDSKGIHSAARLRLNSGGYIGAGTNERIIIRNGTDSAAGTEIKRPGDSKRTFSIKGKPRNSGNVGDLLWVYGNSGSGGDAIHYTGIITGDNHLANKGYVDDADTSTKDYVDDKIEELLAKIEELEMTGGGSTKNYQFSAYNHNAPSNDIIGNQVTPITIMSCSSNSDNWTGIGTQALDSKSRSFIICLEDGYQLNSGRMCVAGRNDSDRYDTKDKVAAFVISDVEVCPPEFANGQNIYRAKIIPDALMNDSTNYFPTWGDREYLYITFADGAITEVP